MATLSAGEVGMRGPWRLVLVVACVVACGGEAPPAGVAPDEAPAPALPVTPAQPPPPVEPPPPPPPPQRFQPAFHQALRWTHWEGELTTYRLRVPVGRAGGRVRLTFRAGEGSLQLQRVLLARAGEGDSLLSAPVPVTFAGQAGARVDAEGRVQSDALPFALAVGEELYVTFEARGALAASAIGALPGSRVRTGAHAHAEGALGGSSWRRAVALATLEVEGIEGPAVVAVGDSITEGYLDGADDVRKAWPGVAQAALGVPVLNAGVSGQGLWAALEHLDEEVLALEGVTDCVVLLGTNDLGADEDSRELRAQLAELFTRLKPLCTVWAATLLPKEKSNHSSYEVVRTQRLVVNRWLREEALSSGRIAGLIDLEAVTRAEDSVHHFAPGLGADGIHPTVRGQRVMGEEVARVLREQGVRPPPPSP